ncbi:MAG: anaerobic ribonucleoside-triphosphate reductase, partial [Lachnospiraceae bacterium]|nr:anaerobic ribonucleoside-triphosphate reductase [Lachnospiraceae bacterium]
MELEKILIRKKNGTLEEYQSEKIAKAIQKSALRCSYPMNDDEVTKVVVLVENRLVLLSDNIVPIVSMHSYVEQALDEIRPDVAKSYRDFRNWKVDTDKEFQAVWDECQTIQFLGDKSNSNADSCLVSTKRVKKLAVLSKQQYEKYFLTQHEKQAVYDGYIYIHDRDSRYDTMNCCLFDIKNVLTGGFEMSNVWYNEPKSIKTAFSVIGDITLMAASQQYG